MPKFDIKFDFVPVPEEFIESRMVKAQGAYVKVYLLALLSGVKGEEITAAEMAEKLDLLESDVIKALAYWKNEGVLSFGSDAEKSQEPKEQTAYPRKKSMGEITEEMTSNKALADLCEISQGIFGRPLKNREIETLYWFYDELGLSPEVITMLLEYCVSMDKRNMNYIEKVAMSWNENGIVTIEAADKFIAAEKEKKGYFGSLRKLFGIDNRNFSKTEETYLKTWRDECGMDENMVGLAYEYCVDAIQKLSFPYMDTIIRRWKELGIFTIEAAEKDHEDFKNKKNKKDFSVYDDKNSDYDEIEKIIREKM